MNAQEVERSIREVWTLFKETDERIAQTNRASDEKFNARIAQMNRETDERIAQTNKETDERIARMNRETNRNIGALTGKWGQFVEGLIALGAVTMFKERGIVIDRIFQRVRAQKNGSQMEIDILGVNGEYAVLIEAKSTLTVIDIKEHEERMGAFKSFFPEYADRKVVGAVAGIVTDKGADIFAYKNGFFVIGQTGDTAAILNKSGFLPRVW